MATDHIGQADIARALGVTRQAVSVKRKRRKDFPAPDVTIDGEPGWQPERLPGIVAWWKSDQEAEANRPGQGAGGGRPRKNPAPGEESSDTDQGTDRVARRGRDLLP